MLFLSLSDKVSNGDMYAGGGSQNKKRERDSILYRIPLSLKSAATYSPTVSQYHRRSQA